jgi:citrate synthase
VTISDGADPSTAEYLSVNEAATVLDVKASTVYAYVSRGMLRSHRVPGDRRSWLRRDDVASLLNNRGRQSQPHESAHPHPLRRQVTELSEISGNRLHYRGREVGELARTTSFEAVAEWLWTGETSESRPWPADEERLARVMRAQRTLPDNALPMDRLKLTTNMLSATDPFRYDLSKDSVIGAARLLISTMVGSMAPAPEAEEKAELPGIATRLWHHLAPTEPTDETTALMSNALVHLADHGLAPSTQAVRTAAALRADPYSAVLAGMGVASGLLHGGSSLATQSWLNEMDGPAGAAVVLGDRLGRGDRVSGFGQPRYRDFDPRAATLLQALRAIPSDQKRLETVESVIDLVAERRGLMPNVEFALGAVAYVHRMTYGAGEAIFVIARSAGWLAHALEEYSLSQGRHSLDLNQP